MERGYQREFSSMHDYVYSLEERRQKGATMVAILRDAMGDHLRDAVVLDLGCSTGIVDEYIAGHVKTMMGVDIDEGALKSAAKNTVASNTVFQFGDAMNLDFPAETFDIVICSQVYEHVPDANQMMSEIHRVLKPRGVCYFAATNRWALIERHYRLPFLSWLPIPLADLYMRSAGKGSSYYERHLGYGPLKRLVSAFRIEDYTQRLLREPERFEAGYMFRSRIKRFVAKFMYRNFLPVFPGYIWLLWKDPE